MGDDQGGRVTEHVTYGELDEGVRAIAARLLAEVPGRSRALLLYPPGLDFVRAFYACLAADVIPVPAYPPDPGRLNRTLPRLRAIAADAGATVALTTAPIAQMAEFLAEQAPDLAQLRWIATDVIERHEAAAWLQPEAEPRGVAFLQYTSGSTAAPRGVAITHDCMMQNLALITRTFVLGDGVAIGTWLPVYHDMGLLGHVLTPAFAGVTSSLMSPISFLQRPLRWLQMITEHGVHASGGPNFGFDLCVRKVKPEERDALHLDTWRVAYNGAEPIMAETLERFTAAYEPHGLRPGHVFPCYGLAEHTLLVTCIEIGEGPKYFGVDPSVLLRGRVSAAKDGPSRRLVSSGKVPPEVKVVIADPENRRRARPGHVGEIWLHSASVAKGYWNRTEDTEALFQAHLADTGEGPFLRTGDLGFLHEGHLFVTGRIKDLIIVRGENHYPQDIERAVERAHAAIRGGCAAAFAVDSDEGEELAVVAEVDAEKAGDLGRVIEEVRRAIASEHAVHPSAVVLIQARSIPKTSSGKIQRRATKVAWLSGELEVRAEWRRPGLALRPTTIIPAPGDRGPAPLQLEPERAAPHDVRPPPAQDGARPAPRVSRSAPEIAAFLVERIADALDVPASTIERGRTFADLGLGSADEVALSADLEDWLGQRIAPTLTWDYPTIDLASRFLSGEDVPPAGVARRGK